MSAAQKRQQLASAVSGVPGVTGHAKRPSTPEVGDAWPLFSFGDRAAGSAFICQWRIRVVLPQEEDDASEWIDEHWPLLYYALEPHGSVRRYAPTVLPYGNGELYALEITMIAEE